MRLTALLLALLAAPAGAQFGPPAEPCPLGTAEGILRGADVEASLFTNGNLFFGNQTTNGDGYLVPLSQTGPQKSGPPSPLFSGAFWVGGLVKGEVRTAVASYARFKFRPGRTGPDGTPPSPAECAAADRIWVVSRDDVAAYLNGSPATADLAEWPVALGAPVLDGDGIAGNYDLAGGDQPSLRGDVMAWWTMTDTAVDDGRLPVGVDVAVEAFALRQNLFRHHTFYKYTVTNRNTVDLDSAYVAHFHDPDLGGAADDYIGVDTTLQVQFVYNSDEADEAYGVPPAFGVMLAEGPVGLPNRRDDDGDGQIDEAGERIGLTHVPGLGKSGATDIGSTPQGQYYRLQGLFGDGTQVYEGLFNGYGPRRNARAVRYWLPADPVTAMYWSEENIDGRGTRNSAGDRRGIVPVGPFRLQPGEAATTTFALVYAQGTDRLHSIQQLRRESRGVRAAIQSGFFDPVRVDGPARPPTPLSVRRPAPNPFTDAATLQIAGLAGGASVRVTVFDALGRRVAAPLTVAASGPVEVGRGLPAGVYLVRVDGAGFSETLRVVKGR